MTLFFFLLLRRPNETANSAWSDLLISKQSNQVHVNRPSRLDVPHAFSRVKHSTVGLACLRNGALYSVGPGALKTIICNPAWYSLECIATVTYAEHGIVPCSIGDFSRTTQCRWAVSSHRLTTSRQCDIASQAATDRRSWANSIDENVVRTLLLIFSHWWSSFHDKHKDPWDDRNHRTFERCSVVTVKFFNLIHFVREGAHQASYCQSRKPLVRAKPRCTAVKPQSHETWGISTFRTLLVQLRTINKQLAPHCWFE